ncbi:MAG: DHH family phosphoesterase [Schleiferiaceae bacterium]|nr:DHH family phosphoesterase [Schleiferiaceae bacterium]
MKVPASFLAQAERLLLSAQKIVVTNHLNPDGDAMGSALAAAALLRHQGKEATVIVPNRYAANLHWIKGNEEVIRFEETPEKARAILRDAQLTLHLDYNALSRSGPLEEDLRNLEVPRMVIDHHRQPEHFAEALYSDHEMSSTCEMVYHWALAMGWEAYLDRDIGEALYAGIATDTGNFRFSSTRSETHQAVAHLLAVGVRPHVVASRIYDSNRPQRFKLLGRALDNMRLLEDRHAVILYLSEKDLIEIPFEKGDTEGFVNYGLSLAGIELSAFCYPWQGRVKMSFRSKSGFDVNQFARQNFQGGGHFNAAGGISDLSLVETIEKIETALQAHAHTLQDLPNFAE